MSATTIHPASANWLITGGARTVDAKTIVVRNDDGGVLKSGDFPMLFAYAGDHPVPGDDVRCVISAPTISDPSTPCEAVVGTFVRAELVESVPLRAPLYYWVISDIRRETESTP